MTRERVLSREKARRYAERGADTQTVINVVIQTPNPAPFRRAARRLRSTSRGLCACGRGECDIFQFLEFSAINEL